MEDTLLKLGYDKEDIDSLISKLSIYNSYIMKKNIDLFIRYNCSEYFIKEIINKRIDILVFDCDRLRYIFDAIIANNDIIEETLFDIV